MLFLHITHTQYIITLIESSEYALKLLCSSFRQLIECFLSLSGSYLTANHM